jgi:hypothetical protein
MTIFYIIIKILTTFEFIRKPAELVSYGTPAGIIADSTRMCAISRGVNDELLAWIINATTPAESEEL